MYKQNIFFSKVAYAAFKVGFVNWDESILKYNEIMEKTKKREVIGPKAMHVYFIGLDFRCLFSFGVWLFF